MIDLADTRNLTLEEYTDLYMRTFWGETLDDPDFADLRPQHEARIRDDAKLAFQGKRVVVEFLGGTHDGLTLDSYSNDATERLLVKLLRDSFLFEEAQKVETDTEVFVQLRPKNPDQTA